MNFKYIASCSGALLVLSAFGHAQTITVKGSDTMVILGQAWAENYMKTQKTAKVSIQGGGSGTGIAALINGTTDICQSSREIKPQEIAKAKARNVTPFATKVALDGVSIAVHASNPVKQLTTEQLRGIYTGKITNWREVGGRNAPIVALSRESNSGTYVYFMDEVLKGDMFGRGVLLLPSTKAIQQELTSNRNAIGYGGLAFFEGKPNVKVLPISQNGKPVFPSDANIRNGKYPLARPLYFYTAGRPSGAIAQFIRYVLSPAGQSVVAQTGYVAIK